MENKEFFYIRGNERRGAEVIAMLEGKGGINNLGCQGCNEDGVYFIGDNGTIYVDSFLSVKSLLRVHGTELKLPAEFKDKQLVWCWDNNDIAKRYLRFYDAKNKGTFGGNGRRHGLRFDNYEPYEGEYPEWAKEALNRLI